MNGVIGPIAARTIDPITKAIQSIGEALDLYGDDREMFEHALAHFAGESAIEPDNLRREWNRRQGESR